MFNPRKAIVSQEAPAAIGPYSQAVQAGELVFVSGQIPLDPASGAVVHGGVAEQTDRAIRNLAAVLRAAGAGLEDVVKTTVYMTDLGQFSVMNEVYARHFHLPAPARATVEVRALPKGALVELDAVAVCRAGAQGAQA